MADDSPSIGVVRRYIEAVQRARASGDLKDFEALRDFLAADFVIKAASPWTDEPWQVMHRGADAWITRLQAPINKSAWGATSSRWSTASSPACGATATSAGSPLAESCGHPRSCRDECALMPMSE